MYRSWLICAIGVFFPLVMGDRVVAQTESDDMDFKFLMRGLRNEREKLRTGEFVGYGVSSIAGVENESSGDVQIRCLFDFARGMFRVDREAQLQSGGNIVTQWIQTRDDICVYNSMFKRVDCDSASDPSPRIIVDLPAIDFRCFGLYHWIDFSEGRQFPEVIERFESHQPVEIVRDLPGVYRLRWQFGDYVQRYVWIDTSQGYAPIKMRVERKFNDSWYEHPQEASDVSWQNRDGVWVPDSFSFEVRHFAPGSDPSRPEEETLTNRYKINWVSLNGELDERSFSYEDFGVPDGTYVADWRSGEPVVTRVVGTD
jgi:hypothetical protein